MKEQNTALKHTPLAAEHRRLGARMVPFAGWEMPLSFGSIIAEHEAVRERAGLFDVSHMGKLTLGGEGALALLQRLATADAGALTPGQAQYSLLCRPEDGGVLDDLLVYRLTPAAKDFFADPAAAFLLIVNAVNCQRDYAWFQTGEAVVRDRTADFALLALQGPRAEAILARLTPLDLTTLPYFAFTVGEVAGTVAFISRTGYTGEDGFEILVAAEAAVSFWQELLAAGEPLGLVPAGLGARDSLRLEAGYCLYGQELTETTTPLEARLGWVVAWEKGDFQGRQALLRQRERGPERLLMGIVLQERAVPRLGYPVVMPAERQVGVVTSGGFSPTLGRGIALAYLERPWATVGTELAVRVRGKDYPGRVVRPPFVSHRVRQSKPEK